MSVRDRLICFGDFVGMTLLAVLFLLPLPNYFVKVCLSLTTFFRLEMNVGGFSEHQNKRSDTERYERYFFTARIPHVNVNTMKRSFEQRSELQVAECLIVHVLSSSYNVFSLDLRKKKATQQWSLRVAIDIVVNQVRLYHESVCGRQKQILVCEVLFHSTFLQIHYKHYFRKSVPGPY